MDIRDKVAVVTGGASGLGAATAIYLANKGVRVAILDHNRELAEKTAKEIDGKSFVCDVTQSASVEAAFDEIATQMGEIRACVNCAGIVTGRRLLGRDGLLPVDEFQKTIQVNLLGTFLVMRIAAAKMSVLEPSADNSRGVIINTASVAGYEGQIGQIAYSASKGGVMGMTLPAARELANFGIRVVTIAPGIFKTPMMGNIPDEAQASLAAQVPFPKRLGEPSEYAQMVWSVIENNMLNGCVIRLDGAIRLQPK